MENGKDTQKNQFGKHIPFHLQEELREAQAKKQGIQADETEEQEYEEPEIEAQSAEAQASQSEPQDKPIEQPVPHSEEDNDVKAWKGRLKKEQAERQNLNAQLIEKSEEISELKQRLKALEEAQAKSTHTQSTQSDPKGKSDELEDLRLVNPELYIKLKQQREAQALVQSQIEQEAPPIQQPQASQEITAPVMSERERIWYAEVQREIPEIQGLLGDPNFVAFAQSKTDWTGVTGLDLIQQAGMKKDVRFIPAIRNLFDEYQQSKIQPSSPVTSPPQKTAAVKVKVNSPKIMTKQDEAYVEMLVRLGKTAELKAFLATFKK